MSRVDEAIRRAAAQSAVAEPETDPSAPAPATGPHADFPVEAATAGAGRTGPNAASAPAATPPAATPVLAAPVAPVTAPDSGPADAGDAAGPSSARDAGAARSTPPGGSIFDRIDSRLSEKVVIDQNMMPASREQYRRLAAVLHDAQGHKGLQVIMVVSATAGEGKTLTAANLALTFSESYQRRVLLIDADLRRPALHSVFRIDTTAGLSDGLSDPDARLILRQVSPRLAILPAGRPNSDPMAGLTSERMRRLLAEAREAFDWVIIDTPPLGLLPDAHLMASMVEGAVLVVRAGSTPFELVKRSVDSVGRSLIVGVVLNNAETSSKAQSYEYYGYGQAAKETLPQRR